MALSDELKAVRSWFSSTPGANPNPSEEDLKYYAQQGINKFLSDVSSIRSANPALATQLDQQRAGMSNTGSITDRLFGGSLPGVAQGNYVPFSALLQPYGSRGYGNYGYGPGMFTQQPGPSGGMPTNVQPQLNTGTTGFPSFLNSWYNPSAGAGAAMPTNTGMMTDQSSQLAQIIAAIQAAMQGQRQPAVTQPVQPVQPLQPTQPVQPMQPVQPVQPVQPTQPAQPAASDTSLENIRQAFLSIPGANPNPDRAALEYYASQGVDKLKSDVAFIRQANPAIAAQIDAERNKLGLS